MKLQSTDVLQPVHTNGDFESDTLSLPGSDAAQRLFKLVSSQRFFKGLGRRQLKTLADSAMEMEYEPNQSIYEEGVFANRFYIILEGKVVVEADAGAEDQGKIFVQMLGPQDDLGWSWLFPPFHTHFSARALTPVKVLLFYAPHLRQECEFDHDLGYELMKRVTAVMLDRLRALRLQLSVQSNAPEAGAGA